MMRSVVVVTLAMVTLAMVASAAVVRRPVALPSGLGRTPTSENCTLYHVRQPVDHFGFLSRDTFLERVFVNSEVGGWAPGGPIWFYTGNEDDVTLYVNATGLMWENAKDFGALLVRRRLEEPTRHSEGLAQPHHRLVFAEHRYYGESLPYGEASFEVPRLQYLTHEQGLADYARVLRWVKREFRTESSKVVAFGGSYGGMLAAWMRMKYPGTIHGAIAASAPILAFVGLEPSWDDESFGPGPVKFPCSSSKSE